MPIKDPEKKKAAQRRADAKRVGRTRNFATIIYPESAPENWREILDDLHVATLISPLHDQDKNPSGELKKPHYHVLMMWESPMNFDTQIAPIFEQIGAVGREQVNSARGYARYLCHLDNPEKHQYDMRDVTQLGGANYLAVIQLPTDDIQILQDVFAFINANEIYSFAEFLDIAAIHRPEWFNTVSMSRAYIVDKYIKSRTWERDTGYQRAIDRTCITVTDPKTGEVFEKERGVNHV